MFKAKQQHWSSLSFEEKFSLLAKLEYSEGYARKNVRRYLKNHSLSEVFNEINEDDDGHMFLAKYQKYTDDIMDIAFIHHENHYWNSGYDSILIDLFLNNHKWFVEMYQGNVFPEESNLEILFP
jgi:hypothetical protein